MFVNQTEEEEEVIFKREREREITKSIDVY